MSTSRTKPKKYHMIMVPTSSKTFRPRKLSVKFTWCVQTAVTPPECQSILTAPVQSTQTRTKSCAKKRIQPASPDGAEPRSDQPISYLTGAEPRSEQPISYLTGAESRADQPISYLTGAESRADQPISSLTGAEPRSDQPISYLTGAEPSLTSLSAI
ncbi:hypothetical protein RRG08_054322 [Elysia crispata]|uniref:Uncharacterized protein n=1 Tax=Elysia crispata TaxID=231223 RepID=A0AAE1B3Y5_9GAST|nr:hypothetical protein RRG08_054322 [Elysia crispata]